MKYVRNLEFEAEPDYDFLRSLFNKVLAKIGEIDDGVYDWMIVMEKRERARRARHSHEQASNAANISNSSDSQRLQNSSVLQNLGMIAQQQQKQQQLTVPNQGNVSGSNIAIKQSILTDPNVSSTNMTANTSTNKYIDEQPTKITIDVNKPLPPPNENSYQCQSPKNITSNPKPKKGVLSKIFSCCLTDIDQEGINNTNKQ